MRTRWRVGIAAVAVVCVLWAANRHLREAVVPAESTIKDEDALPEAIYPAGSTIKDENALGGFGESTNLPRDLAGHDWGTAGEVALVAFPDEPLERGRRKGFALRLINRTAGVVGFAACDSCMYLTQEARGWNGDWRPVESLPQPICGNSSHRVFLGPNHYWEFPAVRRGIANTTFRFRLDLGVLRADEFHTRDGRPFLFAEPGGQVIYSNEFR
jgi:hypothetical protein